MYDVIDTQTTKLGRFEIVLDTIKKGEAEMPYSYVNIKPGVCVIVMVDNKILLLSEYRHAIKDMCYEFPCGMIDYGENPTEAAIREVKEETGFEIEDIVNLVYTYPSFGSTTEKIYLFFARCTKQSERKLDALEEISWSLVPVDEIDRMVKDNEIVCGAATTAWGKWRMLLP